MSISTEATRITQRIAVGGLLAHPGQKEAIARTGYEKAAAFIRENYVEELLAKVEKCLR